MKAPYLTKTSQKNLNRIRTEIARYRSNKKDVDLVASIIGLNLNLNVVSPYLNSSPAEIARIYQMLSGFSGQSSAISPLEIGEVPLKLHGKASQWKCSTADLPSDKKWEFGAYFQCQLKDNLPGPYIITIHPNQEEARLLAPYEKKLLSSLMNTEITSELGIAPYQVVLLGFASVLPASLYDKDTDVLIGTTIQTTIFNKSVGLSKVLRRRYNYLDRLLLLAMENFAKSIGTPLIWITTANYQLRKWNFDKLLTIHPFTAFNLYAKTPYTMGYSLREINPLVLDTLGCDLVWEKDLNAY